MQPEEITNPTIFHNNTSSENVVKVILTVLKAHHEREAEILNEILGSFSMLYTYKLAARWEQLLLEYNNEEIALRHLTQVIASELDSL